MAGFTYHRFEKYGSPEIDRHPLVIRSATVGDGRRCVGLVVDGLREGYVHELQMEGIRSAAGQPLLHREAYYTVNVIPGGDG